jgi:antitoxin ParD1/3/4
MPTRNISLTPEQDAFIEEAVSSGEYQNASEAVRDALRALQQRRREDAFKLEALRQQIDAGVEELDRGEFIEVADAELEAYLDGLTDRKPGALKEWRVIASRRQQGRICGAPAVAAGEQSWT